MEKRVFRGVYRLFPATAKVAIFYGNEGVVQYLKLYRIAEFEIDQYPANITHTHNVENILY
jgi:hypothetical protein